MSITIRAATHADVGPVGALLAEGHAVHVAGVPWRFRQPPDVIAGEQRREEVLGWLEDGALFVAEEAGDVVGAIRLTALEVPPGPALTPRRYVFVQEVVVEAQRRRRGIGKALMEQAQQWADQQGIDQIELNVFEFNRAAIAFYEALGYATVQRRMWRRLR